MPAAAAMSSMVVAEKPLRSNRSTAVAAIVRASSRRRRSRRLGAGGAVSRDSRVVHDQPCRVVPQVARDVEGRRFIVEEDLLRSGADQRVALLEPFHAQILRPDECRRHVDRGSLDEVETVQRKGVRHDRRLEVDVDASVQLRKRLPVRRPPAPRVTRERQLASSGRRQRRCAHLYGFP
nr:hypothetical protein [Microbacterium sp. XT11]